MRFRDAALAIAHVVALPLIWLWSLPGALCWARLEARAERDRRAGFEPSEVRGARRWERDFDGMASGLETYALLELELADGRRVVRHDESGRIARELASRGMSKIACTHLGKDVSLLAMLVWVVYVALPIAVVAVSWRACRS
jgi:hypothetical protein